MPLALIVLLLSGCAVSQDLSRTPRTAIEQLLLSQALERSLKELTVPLGAGESVVVDATGFQTDRVHMHKIDENLGVIDTLSWDLSFVRDVVASRLGELGYRVRKHDEEAAYLVRIVVQALGTNQGQTFFGMPPVQSVILPFALPELSLYKRQDQMAYVRLYLDIFETASGRFIRSTPWYIGRSFYNQYTLLFFFTFSRTDLIEPP